MKDTKSPIQSMTGFSSLEVPFGEQTLRIELKSLNHRFLEVKCRITKELSGLETFIRQEISQHFNRGAIECKLELVSASTDTLPLYNLNIGLAAHYFESLNTLKKTLGLTSTIELRDILQFPDTVSRKVQDLTDQPQVALWDSVAPHLKKALSELQRARQQEGDQLKKALESIESAFSSELTAVRSQMEKSLKTAQERLQEKLKEVLEQHPLPKDPSVDWIKTRAAQEVALLVDRSDIEEEFTRTEAHLHHFRELLAQGGAVGRKLDFILQELNREVNTMGSKALDYSISKSVILLKSMIEQLKEQSLNLQ